MPVTKLLVANRGEVAVRIVRAASELGIATVAVHAEDDASARHVTLADDALALAGRGPAAYLDGEALVAAALASGADAVHPGYGFLSERAGFARLVLDAGLAWVGPAPETLEQFGDKAAARALAQRCGVPVLRGTPGPATLEDASAFLVGLGEGGAVLLKAVAGGGGRGMRAVRSAEELPAAYERCQAEAALAFGRSDVYAEELLTGARHIEVQVLGDASGAVSHLGERECTLQRRYQKLVEVAPSPGISAATRRHVLDAALRLAEGAGLQNLATIELLVAPGGDGPDRIAFIEANPRLQVEHTVTEEITGVDLVQVQLALAAGRTLADLGLGLDDPGRPEPRGRAVQVRVNLETLLPDGTVRPEGGVIGAFEPPAGPGVRVDTLAYGGYRTSANYDSLLAKVIVHVPSGELGALLAKADRALGEFRIDGVRTNIPMLRRLLTHPGVVDDRIDTAFVEDHLGELTATADEAAHDGTRTALAGARLASDDPLAVLEHGKQDVTAGDATPIQDAGPDGTVAVRAPLQGTIVSIDVAPGDEVFVGMALLVMEAMKMQHVVSADVSGIVHTLGVTIGDTVFADHALVFLTEAEVAVTGDAAAASLDLDAIRPDLAEVRDRHDIGLDEHRPDAVARRRRTRQRTARENVDDLVDPGSFMEYAPLVVAAQRRRRTMQDLIERTPADGLVGGVGDVNGHLFDDRAAKVVALSYDYTVLAGTQGHQNHRKKDRLFELAERNRLPIVLFAEGGGGRPGDTDGLGVAGLDCMAFHLFGRLSGLVPLVGITSGRCFAGNAALLGCCDVVIATEGSNIGMGGPAMIEGGGLGIFRPEEVGPMDVQVPNGVVDIPVADEAEAVAVAKRYLSYFQGPVAEWSCADQRLLRSAIPENRLRVYDVRHVIETLADDASVLELRRHFGLGMVTALARIEGRPVGIVANNPTHLAGAIDADGADKAARFLQLCDAFDLPVVFLCDTPGIMVGPEAEKEALVRHASRLFVIGSNLSVPFCTIILRKGYGLGAQAMAGGSFKAPLFTVAWPTGEFGGMGLEGAVKLGYRNELAAVDDPAERKALFDEMVARMYEHGKAVSMASAFEIDDVIDPVESRRWITSAFTAAAPPAPRDGKKRACVDTW